MNVTVWVLVVVVVWGNGTSSYTVDYRSKAECLTAVKFVKPRYSTRDAYCLPVTRMHSP